SGPPPADTYRTEDAPSGKPESILRPNIIYSLLLFTGDWKEWAQPDKSGGSVHVHAQRSGSGLGRLRLFHQTRDQSRTILLPSHDAIGRAECAGCDLLAAANALGRHAHYGAQAHPLPQRTAQRSAKQALAGRREEVDARSIRIRPAHRRRGPGHRRNTAQHDAVARRGVLGGRLSAGLRYLGRQLAHEVRRNDEAPRRKGPMLH